MGKIYMDHAATTPVDEKVLEVMMPYFSEKYGNASSLHRYGREAHEALEASREKISGFLGVSPKEIIFTSGGTESNNLALKGIAMRNKERGKHIITSFIEHKCIMNMTDWLKKHGFEITYLPVDKYGMVNPEDVENSIRKDTIIVSVMYANNEIGTIEPVNEIGKICGEHEVPFHTDAVQAFGSIKIGMKNIDMLSASSHKLYGPKGTGCLFVKNGIKLDPLIHGGGQEFNLRGSTQNIPNIVGFSKAVELAENNMNREAKRLAEMRNKLIKNLTQIENSNLNGHKEKRLPNNVNISFRFIEGEALVIKLDDKGISASTGSACSSNELKPSHVLTSIGLSPEEAHGSLRLTLGKQNTEKDINYASEIIPKVIEELRTISPFKENFKFTPTKGFENYK